MKPATERKREGMTDARTLTTVRQRSKPRNMHAYDQEPEDARGACRYRPGLRGSQAPKAAVRKHGNYQPSLLP